MKSLYVVGMVLIVIFLSVFLWTKKPAEMRECEKDEDCLPKKPLVGLRYYCENGICKTKPFGNPASEYCVEHNGTLKIRSDEEGNQYGVCIFSDGSECEEWSYYRGECQPSTNYPTTVPEHHGSSTFGRCSNDNDCVVSGCNREICQSKFEESMFSICVYNPPYPKELGYECRCIGQKCAWTK
jgi:eight-cysteine-cluster-containing protein